MAMAVHDTLHSLTKTMRKQVQAIDTNAHFFFHLRICELSHCLIWNDLKNKLLEQHNCVATEMFTSLVRCAVHPFNYSIRRHKRNLSQ